MSRSYKHYPHIGFADSEKYQKRFVNKRFRKRAKTILDTVAEPEFLSNSDFPTLNDIKDPYYFPKDGGIDIDIRDGVWWYLYFIDGKIRK